MNRTALYQKYRSQSFDEVVGQEYVVRSIQNAIQNQKIGHAYLFCGPRGTGKTTMARLLAKAIVCENPQEAPCGKCPSCIAAQEGTHPDIIEVNAANETHVEDIRDLIERVKLAPMQAGRKVYIIDEVHQLSSSAASALLKTLEEPPEHVVFILATTDPQKLINTIISRCQRFDFTKVEASKIAEHLLNVAKQEEMTLEESAAEKIAELADGGMRDALSILDQISSFTNGNITEEEINRVYGLTTLEQKMEILNNIFQQDMENLLENMQAYELAGLDLKKLTNELINVLKDAVLWHYSKNERLLKTVKKEDASHLSEVAPVSLLLKMMNRIITVSEQYRSGQSVSTLLEIACMEMISWQGEQVTEHESVESIKIEPYPKNPERVQKEKVVEQKKKEKKNRALPRQEIQALVEKREELEHTCMDVVSLLVQCDKEHKAEATAKLEPILQGPPEDRYAAMLQQLEIKACGEDCILLAGGSDVAVRSANEVQFQEGFEEWFQTQGLNVVPFVIHQDLYEDAVQQFLELRGINSLPEKMVIQKKEKKIEEAKEDSLEERVKNIFGNLVEIEEGETNGL